MQHQNSPSSPGGGGAEGLESTVRSSPSHLPTPGQGSWCLRGQESGANCQHTGLPNVGCEGERLIQPHLSSGGIPSGGRLSSKDSGLL